MSVQDLEEAFELIEENGGDFEGSKDELIIKKAESELGLIFPPTYRQFLSKYGCGDIEGLEFYGIIHDDFHNSGVPDAVWLTANERKSGLPAEMIVVGSTGDGGYFVLDTSKKSSNGECEIFIYTVNGNTVKYSNDFGSFLLKELKTVLV